ncbi:MAG: response regulator [Candidatus Pristimantibacillus sp.]
MSNPSNTYRVMIVDDEAILRTGIYHLCNWIDFDIEIVAQASNGEEALQLIEQVHPHVVITDIVMPIMDGVELSKHIRNHYPDIKVVVLSSYSEFNNVREVFKYGVTDYLLKPKVTATELVTLIQSLCSHIHSEQLSTTANLHAPDHGLLISELLNSDGNRQAELAKELTLHFTHHQLHLVKCSTTLLLAKTHMTQVELERSILQLAQVYLTDYKYACFFVNNECSIVLNYDHNQVESVLSSLDHFTRSAKQSLLYVTFLLSREFSSWNDLPSVDERLTLCTGKTIYFNHKHCISEDSISPNNTNPSFQISMLVSTIQKLELDQSRAILKALFSEIKSGQAYDEYSLKRFCQNLIYTSINAVEQMKIPLSTLSSTKIRLFKTIDIAVDVDELLEIIYQFIDHIEMETSAQSGRGNTLIMTRIYEYVNENYTQDIKLAELAEVLHLNYSYLSYYFKHQTNENLTTYINKVRVEKAKQLLLDWNLSISEISRMTGFSEHNYFSKVFKKMTNMTPVEYRNQSR